MSGTLKVTTLQDGASSTANMTFDSSGNATVGNNLTVTGTAAMASSFKRNRIINGNMLIDQRNAGASVTPPATSIAYTVDRWFLYASQTSKLSVQQNAGAITPPIGFSSYVGLTSLSAYSITSTDQFAFQQRIEGFNIADLNWGTANAKPVVLSFWAYSSLTGTFGGCLNDTGAPSYPFTYSIPVANTWTYITLAIAGPTIGTWSTTNTSSVSVIFSLGAGSTLSGTAGAWVNSSLVSATGAVSIVGTSSATFYITGVQLEVGTKATPYEMQIYSDQLAQCQRYYYVANTNAGGNFLYGSLFTTTAGFFICGYPVSMRTNPTVSYTYNTSSFTANYGSSTVAQLYSGSVTTGISLSAFAASAEL